MSWRTVVLSKKSKASFKDGYLIIKNENEYIIHLSEIGTVIFESTAINVTTYLLCELAKAKVKMVFCDHKRNPYGEIIPYYGRYNVSKRIAQQIGWNKDTKRNLWTEIVKQKILNQSKVLEKYGLINESKMLIGYANNIKAGDETNREGHAAKVYFNALFGKNFKRGGENLVNAPLDYGYSIILSTFNREISTLGYLTTLGINHTNEFNHFNLTSDIMEPFRQIVDDFVYKHRGEVLDSEYKKSLVNLLNETVFYNGKNCYVSYAISEYCRSFFRAIEKGDIDEFEVFKL